MSASLLVGADLAASWGIVALEWLIGAVCNARHARGQVEVAGVALLYAILVVVPRSYLGELTVQALWVRVLGLVVLGGSTAFIVVIDDRSPALRARRSASGYHRST